MQYITINQKQHPVKFGFAALAEFCDLANITLAQMSNPAEMATKLTLTQCIKLCYIGLKSGAREARQPCGFDGWEQLAEALDNPENVADEILQAGLSAMTKSVTPPPTKLDKEKAEQPGKDKGSQ